MGEISSFFHEVLNICWFTIIAGFDLFWPHKNSWHHIKINSATSNCNSTKIYPLQFSTLKIYSCVRCFGLLYICFICERCNMSSINKRATRVVWSYKKTNSFSALLSGKPEFAETFFLSVHVRGMFVRLIGANTKCNVWKSCHQTQKLRDTTRHEPSAGQRSSANDSVPFEDQLSLILAHNTLS